MSSFAAQTHPGLNRARNEDEVAALTLPGGAVLLVVADGVGGAPGGDLASNTAVSVVVEALTRGDGLTAAINLANERVIALQGTRRDVRHMATTLVVAFIEAGAARVANLGDSRAYALVGGELRQVSRDDSWVADAVESGEFTREEAERHPWRNVVTKGIGVEDGGGPAFYDVPLAPGDTLLLATDGLFKMLKDEEIGRLLMGARDAENAAAALVGAANAAGGMDNIGVAVYIA